MRSTLYRRAPVVKSHARDRERERARTPSSLQCQVEGGEHAAQIQSAHGTVCLGQPVNHRHCVTTPPWHMRSLYNIVYDIRADLLAVSRRAPATRRTVQRHMLPYACAGAQASTRTRSCQ